MVGIRIPAQEVLDTLARPFADVSPRRARLILVALSMGGVAFTILLLWVGYRSGQFGGPNDYSMAFDPAGDMLRAGVNPYQTTGLPYSPPLLLVFAGISWLPVPVAGALLCCAEVLALRYIVGSWIGVGIAAWCPLLAFELVLGNPNLVLGACIVAAVRGHGWAGVAGGLIKLSPLLAIREWRSAGWALLLVFVLTLPWIGLWADWVHLLLAALPAGNVGGPIVPVPLPLRAVVALGLLLLRRPTATALACVVAIPAFHYQTLLLLVVPLAVWIRGRRATPGVDLPARPGRPVAASGA
jgi:hypothetical protein